MFLWDYSIRFSACKARVGKMIPEFVWAWVVVVGEESQRAWLRIPCSRSVLSEWGESPTFTGRTSHKISLNILGMRGKKVLRIMSLNKQASLLKGVLEVEKVMLHLTGWDLLGILVSITILVDLGVGKGLFFFCISFIGLPSSDI